MPVSIRTIQLADAEPLLQLQHQLDRETQFMLFEPGERTRTSAEQHRYIEHLQAEGHSTIFVAEDGGQLVGYLSATGSALKRVRHTAYIVIGIRKAYTGQGIGTNFFAALEEWASQKHLHRLELTVMAHNQAGIALYQKRGFVIEGTKKHAIVLNGEYIDEYAMAKLLA